MKKALIKSILNGLITWFVVALAVSLIRDIAFLKVLIEPFIIVSAVTAAVGSYAGFLRKEKMEEGR
jgi:hypothetical protein